MPGNSSKSQQHFQRARALHQAGELVDALKAYQRAAALDPKDAPAQEARGIILAQLGRLDEALKSLNLAVALNPRNADGYVNRGNVLNALNRPLEAMSDFDRAIALQPGHALACYNKATVLAVSGAFAEALALYEQVLLTRPDHADTHHNMGNVLKKLNRPDEAGRSYENAAAIAPDNAVYYSSSIQMKSHLSDWETSRAYLRIIEDRVRNRGSSITPFVLLAFSDDAELILANAINYSRENGHHSDPNRPRASTSQHDRLRIGYFSADFHGHATMHLIAEMLERHDRDRFELVAFSYGPEKDDDWQRRVVGACDRFIDVRAKPDQAVATLARDLEIDIAIDLKGFTEDARTGIFAERAAPVQVSYLGYPGTMGAPFIDYIIADPLLIPEESRRFYSEKIVTLPDVYQANCRTRAVSERPVDRQSAGLPEHGFVYCCFNQNYKITPDIFDVWMSILRRVDGSVLWLWVDHATARDNLRREAVRRGVDRARLVFAERLAADEHLNRLRLADLFLDTLPCTAHTTASDALRMGLPLLTCLGQSFAARVAASLLNAVGTPELIATTLADYEALAVRLGNDPDQFARLRQKLADSLPGCALYDSERFTRALERAYLAMHERSQAGLPPDHIVLA
jgi:predicted O-linked N-acetylglucosamine transferase (SPINDLY family)